MDRQQREMHYLLAFDCDRLLAPFQKVAGIKPAAPNLGGWESAGLASHYTGHFLSASAMMYAHTHHTGLLAKIDYLLPRLAVCQKANGAADRQFRGYGKGIPGSKAAFAQVLAGNINPGDPHAAFTFSLNGMWSPWYTVHKIMAGLRDVYLHTGRQQAKTILIGMTEWAAQFGRKMTEAQIKLMLISEQGGMNEVLADVYAITGNQGYLKLAKQFNQKLELDPLMRRQDILAGHHANQYIPRVIGLATQYELTGIKAFRTGAEFFWQNPARHRTYSFGGTSNREFFYPIGTTYENLSTGSAESCCTYNMLKLTDHYFCWNATMGAADYFERGLLNHILGSQDPVAGMMTYYISMRPGHFKTFCTPWDSCWCCSGTGMENHSKYGQGIYYHHGDTLWVNLYAASELRWKTTGITLTQTTRFPEDNSVRINISCKSPVHASILLRHPYWSTPGMDVHLNGQTIHAGKPGEYLTVSRKWSNGDTLDITLKTPLRVERMPHHPSYLSIFAGPILLAAALGDALMKPPIPYASFNQYQWQTVPDPEIVPALVTGGRPADQWVIPDAPHPKAWHTRGAGRPADVKLVPFYKVSHERYVTYFSNFTEAQWRQRQSLARARKQISSELAHDAVDHFEPGNAASERTHDLRHLDDSAAGYFEGRSWRDARCGGGFTFRMKVDPNKAMSLVMQFWGSDSGGRVFDVLVNGHRIGTETLANDRPGRFFYKEWSIAPKLLKGKHKIEVRLQAHPGMMAGGLFGCWTIGK
jgi:DUF1680 family protein